MTMKLELTPEVQAGLMTQARASGLLIEKFAEQVLQEKSRIVEAQQSAVSAATVVRRLATFGKRHNLLLGGLSLKELLRESRP